MKEGYGGGAIGIIDMNIKIAGDEEFRRGSS
jgi:hypothetical protein